jgi:hypothetical protein
MRVCAMNASTLFESNPLDSLEHVTWLPPIFQPRPFGGSRYNAETLGGNRRALPGWKKPRATLTPPFRQAESVR